MRGVLVVVDLRVAMIIAFAYATLLSGLALMAEKLDKQNDQVGKCHCKTPVLASGFRGRKE